MLLILAVLEVIGYIAGCSWLQTTYFEAVNLQSILICYGCPLLYLLIGGFARFNPDMTDLGYLGGLVDRPFSWSDDRNRYLLGLKIFFWPARLLMTPFLELFRRLGD